MCEILEFLSLKSLPNKALFISDTHFGAQNQDHEPDYEKQVIELISIYVKQDYRLFLLGDIFDYWMQVGSATPPVAPSFRAALKTWTADGVKVYMVTGNHDNWTGDYFPKMGINEVKQAILTEQGDLLCHGDGFTEKSLGLARPLKHQILRHSLFVRLFQRLFSVQKAWQIMKNFSQNSAKKPKDPQIECKKLDEWSAERISRKANRLIICGHDHQARLHQHAKGVYLNTGYFRKERTFALLEGSTIRLLQVYQAQIKELQRTCIS